MAKNKVGILARLLGFKNLPKNYEDITPGTKICQMAREKQHQYEEFFDLIKKFLKSVPSKKLLSEIIDKFIDLYIVPSGFSEKPPIKWRHLNMNLLKNVTGGEYGGFGGDRAIRLNKSLLPFSVLDKAQFLVFGLEIIAHEFQHHLQYLKLHERQLNETTRAQLNEILTYQSMTIDNAYENSRLNAETFYALWDLTLRKEFEKTSSKSKSRPKISKAPAGLVNFALYLRQAHEVNARWASDIYLQNFVESLPENFPKRDSFVEALYMAKEINKRNTNLVKQIDSVIGDTKNFSSDHFMDLAIGASGTRKRFDFQANRYYLVQGDKYKDSDMGVWMDRMREDVRNLLQVAMATNDLDLRRDITGDWDVYKACEQLVELGFCEAAKIVLDEALAVCENNSSFIGGGVYYVAFKLFPEAVREKGARAAFGGDYLSMKTLSKNVQEEFSKRYYETLCYGDVTEGSFDFIYLLNSDQLNDIISQYIREGKFDFVTQIMNINESRLKMFTTQKLEISPDLEAIETRLERLQNQIEKGEACYDDINDLICFIDYLCLGSVPDYHLECYSPFDQEAFADVKMQATSASDKDYQFKQTLFNLYRKAEWLGYQQAKIICKQKYNRELTPLHYRYHHGTDRQEFLLPKEEEDKRIEKLYGENQRKYIEMFENEWSTTEKVEEHAENK